MRWNKRMNNSDLFANEKVKLRLIQLDYEYKEKFKVNNPSELVVVKQNFEEDVRRIYMEETHQRLSDQVEIFTSIEIIKNNKELKESIRNSGYDGTAIYIEDKENKVNQLHIISQGSQEQEDWLYNGFGLFLGMDYSQYEATREFTQETKNMISNTDTLKTYAMGHSLANNNQIMVQLIDGQFNGVYGVNGAQVSIDHLLLADRKLYRYIEASTSKSLGEIDSIPTELLKEKIIKYYEDKGVTANITQRISYDDPLYGVSGKADFITFGEVSMIDTNPNVEGIRSIIDSIPDEDVRKIQTYLQQYTADYQSGGLNGFLKAATGIDLDLIESIKEADGFLNKMKTAYSRRDELFSMRNKVLKNLPVFLEMFHLVMDNSGGFIDHLEKNGYMDEETKVKVKTELNHLNKYVSEVEAQFKRLQDEDLTIFDIVDVVINIADYISKIKKSYSALLEELEGPLHDIVEGHGILPILNALSAGGQISYKKGDLYYSGQNASGSVIKWNISSAVRMYQKGLKMVEDIEQTIRMYEQVYRQEIEDDFRRRKQALLSEIHHMEENPSQYAWEFPFNLGYGSKLEKIHVHEAFYTGALPNNQGIIVELRKQAEEKRKFIKEIRSSVEEFFKQEQRITELFDLGV
jgi:hypothetical protein